MNLPPPILAAPRSPDLEAMETLLLTGIREQHPEWISQDGDSPLFEDYRRKLSVLFGSLGNTVELSA
jgi:hypothetical protein